MNKGPRRKRAFFLLPPASVLQRRVVFPALCFLSPSAIAHSPVFDCFNEGEQQVTCEGGFSDGASATGIAVRVTDASGKVLVDGKIDADGRFAFTKPDQDFQVLFDAGAGHTVTIYSSDIT